ncbi:MAG: hypothetical protein AAGF46_01015 [Pseudomonadota bacterium]
MNNEPMPQHHVRTLLTQHWFMALAPMVVVLNIVVTQVEPMTALIEFGVLFDLVVLIPVCYALCYRKRRSGTGIRTIALACLGVWVATKLVPEGDRALLAYIEPVRYLGLAVLVLLELALIRRVFSALSSGSSADAVVKRTQEQGDMPEWVARLLVWEAGLWRRLAAVLRRILGLRPRNND